MGTAVARALRPLRSLRKEERGVTLIEAVAALSLFAIVAAALIGLLSSAISANTFSREKTAGEQIVNDQMEWIRSQDYNDVGTVSGNPTGTIATTGLKCPTPAATCDTNPVSSRGVIANVATEVRYVDDPAPTSYATQANYKRVTVTVTRVSDGRRLAQGVSYVAPPSRAPLGGLNNAIINATVVDFGDQALPPVGDATVGLTSSSPLANRSDTTSQTGLVSFAALTPNPTATDYYTLAVTPPTGFVVLKDDDIAQTPTSAAARVSLAPGQTWPTTLRIYRPSTIYVNLADSQSTASTADDTPYTGAVTVQLTGPGTASYTCPGSSPSVYACAGGQLTVWKIAGEPVKPGDYQVSTSGPFLSTPISQYVPNSYPSDLTATYTMPLTLLGGLTVTVRANGVTAIAGATVKVSGGPASIATQTATTNASGQATFTNLPAGSGYTVTATKNGAGASTTATVIANTNTTVDLSLAVGSVPVTVRWGPGGPAVPNAQVTIIGPGSYSDTQTANGSGVVTFTDLPAGPGYDVSAVKAGYPGGPVAATAASPGTNVDVALPATGTIAVTVNWGLTTASGTPVPAANATVTVTGGPDAQSYTDTTNASGVANVVVPPTTAANPYTVQAQKTGSNSVPAANVTSVTSSGTVPRTIALTPTKTLTLTIKAGPSSGTNIPGQPVTVSLTGPPNGAVNVAPAYQFVGNTNASSQVILTVPTALSGSSTYRVKVYRGTAACSGTTANSKINTTLAVTAGAGPQSANIVLTSSTCPTLP